MLLGEPGVHEVLGEVLTEARRRRGECLADHLDGVPGRRCPAGVAVGVVPGHDRSRLRHAEGVLGAELDEEVLEVRRVVGPPLELARRLGQPHADGRVELVPRAHVGDPLPRPLGQLLGRRVRLVRVVGRLRRDLGEGVLQLELELVDVVAIHVEIVDDVGELVGELLRRSREGVERGRHGLVGRGIRIGGPGRQQGVEQLAVGNHADAGGDRSDDPVAGAERLGEGHGHAGRRAQPAAHPHEPAVQVERRVGQVAGRRVVGDDRLGVVRPVDRPRLERGGARLGVSVEGLRVAAHDAHRPARARW